MFSSGGPSVWSLTRYDGEVSEPLVGCQGPLPEAFAVFVQRVRTQRAGAEAPPAAKIPLHLREES